MTTTRANIRVIMPKPEDPKCSFNHRPSFSSPTSRYGRYRGPLLAVRALQSAPRSLSLRSAACPLYSVPPASSTVSACYPHNWLILHLNVTKLLQLCGPFPCSRIRAVFRSPVSLSGLPSLDSSAHATCNSAPAAAMRSASTAGPGKCTSGSRCVSGSGWDMI